MEVSLSEETLRKLDEIWPGPRRRGPASIRMVRTRSQSTTHRDQHNTRPRPPAPSAAAESSVSTIDHRRS